MFNNKKLVIICNSLSRLKLYDKLSFRDEFNGEVFIVTDDRYTETYKELENFLVKEAVNINLRKAKLVLFMRDMYEYIRDKVEPGQYEDALRNMLFTITATSHIYFCRNVEDIAFIIEDDVVLFKNPINMMDGLTACSVHNLPFSAELNEKLKIMFKLQGDDIIEKINMDENDPDFAVNLDKKYGKLIGQATTIWTYLPDFPKYMRDFLNLDFTVKNINYNRNHNCKLYHRGFTFMLERMVGCFLIAHGAKFFTEEQLTMQDRSKFIYNAKKIAEGKVGAYHYTIISDNYVNKWLPYLLENGYDKYKEATKGLEETSREAKYAYMDTKLMTGWNIKGKLKERVQNEKKPKIPFFLRNKIKNIEEN